MTSFLVESSSLNHDPLIDVIHSATNTQIICLETLDVCLRELVKRKGIIGLILVTIHSNPTQILGWLQELRRELRRLYIRVPKIIALSTTEFTPSMKVNYRDMDIRVVPRNHPKQICSAIRLAMWSRLIHADKPTLRITFHDGHHSVVLVGTARQQELLLTAQLRKMVVLFANAGSRGFTTEELGDELGVCKQSVKKYLAELRKRYDQANQHAMGIFSGDKTFWTKRGPGGSLHGINAHIVW